MNILIYTHEFPPFQGGIATSSKMIADILSSENNLMVWRAWNKVALTFFHVANVRYSFINL